MKDEIRRIKEIRKEGKKVKTRDKGEKKGT
jgi:hypothetical protein